MQEFRGFLKKQITEFKENLIAVTSGIYGDVPNAILNFGEQKRRAVFLWWKEQFGDDFMFKFKITIYQTKSI